MALNRNLKDASDPEMLYDPDRSDVEDILGAEILTSLSRGHHNRRVDSLEDDLLAEDLSDSDSENSFTNYSDGSTDDYVPRVDELETLGDQEFLQSELAANVVQTPTFTPIDLCLPGPSHITTSVTTHRLRQRRTQTQEPVAPWLRVYPPEPEQEIASKFTVADVGPRNTPVSSNPLEFFNLFMTSAMWALMVSETNKNAHAMLCQRREDRTMRQHSTASQWVDVTVEEMKKFWAILINMGITRRKTLADYWESSVTQLIPFYPMMMTLKRFQLIMAMFHLSSKNCPQQGQPGYDPWLKIRDFVDMMNDSFKKYFVPGQEVCIDESMVGMKNGCAFIQYVPNKRHARFGIKKFEMCDSKTSYVLHVSLYSGKDFLADDTDPFTQKVVKDLMTRTDCLGKGYHLFTDNYYTKIPLCHFLLSNKTYLTGTVNKTSKELSQNVVEAELATGETLYYRKGDVLLLKYKEKHARKPVHLVTTACHAENIVTRRSDAVKTKPMLIHRYNTFMVGVDNKDKSIYHLTCSRPCKKYWRKIVYNFVDMAIFNAWILFKAQNPQYRRLHNFIVDLVRKLCFKPGHDAPVPGLSSVHLPIPSTSTATSSSTSLSSHRLTKSVNGNAKLCVVCNENDKVKSRSKYFCPPCNGGVHKSCFPRMQHFIRVGRGRKMPTFPILQ